MIFLTLAAYAQEMHIEQYAKLKKGPFNIKHVVIDKQQAILDLKTGEKGFTFLADGKTSVQAEEGDGMLTLKVPNKTAFIVIKHSDYGQLTWKVPGKEGLRKKKHYQATLITLSPEKEYKLQKQWVIFEIQPPRAILTIDSTMTAIHEDKTQFSLPIGKHTYRVEAPFHQEVVDSFELDDQERQLVQVFLQPFYSYLTVKTAIEDCDIYVDGQRIGKGLGTSGHLFEGTHRLTVIKDQYRYYDADVSIGRSEKRRIELSASELYPRKTIKHGAPRLQPVTTDSLATVNMTAPTIYAPVTITAADDSTGIWVDRELKGHGSWEGRLEAGFHLISTEKEGMESRSTTLWIDDESPKQIDLLAPMASFGLVNVHSNEIGANVYINDKLVGTTPCVVKDLPAGWKIKVRLEKEGFHQAEKDVRIISNDLVDINLKLIKNNNKKKK